MFYQAQDQGCARWLTQELLLFRQPWVVDQKRHLHWVIGLLDKNQRIGRNWIKGLMEP